jgi:filamentous hemagglutinin
MPKPVLKQPSSSAPTKKEVSFGEQASANPNAQAALSSKLRQLEKAQREAAKTRELPDGRVRYYSAERLASKPGPTRGNSYVVEHNPSTGQVKSWMESYDHKGNVTRSHPKSMDGQTLKSQHFPLTGKEQ